MTEVVLARVAVEPCEFQRADDGWLQVTALMVPWMSPTLVMGYDRSGGEFAYSEQFAPSAFDRYLDPQVARRVRLVWQHSNAWTDQLGRCTSYQRGDQGAIGVFKVAPTIAERVRE